MIEKYCVSCQRNSLKLIEAVSFAKTVIRAKEWVEEEFRRYREKQKNGCESCQENQQKLDFALYTIKQLENQKNQVRIVRVEKQCCNKHLGEKRIYSLQNENNEQYEEIKKLKKIVKALQIERIENELPESPGSLVREDYGTPLPIKHIGFTELELEYLSQGINCL